MRRICTCTLLVLAVATTTAAAQSGPRVVKLTLHPAQVPIPSLKYHLLPWANELKPGNSAIFYQRAHSPEIVSSYLRSPDFQNLGDWLDKPLTPEMAKKLAGFAPSQAARELDQAARCSYVDWQLTERAREEGYMLLLYDVQSFRSLVLLLAARMRLEIHQGEVTKAVYSLQTGLAAGRDICRTPILISYLVGVAVCTTMLNQAEDLVQLPHTPCLYWAFTELPDSLVDARYSLQGERMFLDNLFPEVRQVLDDPRLPPISADRMRERMAKLSALGIDAPTLGYAALAALVYPEARRYFLELGRSAEQLDAMPVTQVAMMYEMAMYDRWFDDFYKLQSLPYWQARPLAHKLNEELRQARGMRKAGMLLVTTVMPAYERILAVPARLQRRIALLRTIEALRLYAALHDGRLPDTLEEIRDVPLPVDPITGQAFPYRRQTGGRATLEAPPPPGMEANEGNAIRYQITLAAPKQ